MGIIGNAIGTVPAISNDIDGGMDPTKAVVSESAGAATGMTLGTVLGAGAAGALSGSTVPGVGTAVGFVVGIGASAAAAYGTSKGIQALW